MPSPKLQNFCVCQPHFLERSNISDPVGRHTAHDDARNPTSCEQTMFEEKIKQLVTGLTLNQHRCKIRDKAMFCGQMGNMLQWFELSVATVVTNTQDVFSWIRYEKK